MLNLIDKGSLQMHRWIDAPGSTQIAGSLPESNDILFGSVNPVEAPAKPADDVSPTFSAWKI